MTIDSLDLPSKRTDEEEIPVDSQSLSAPSSPVRAPEPPPRLSHSRGGSTGSGSQRPKSMALANYTVVPASSLKDPPPEAKYADISFAYSRPVPKPRNSSVSYSQIRLQQAKGGACHETLPTEGGDEPPPLPPARVEDLPPPPPPMDNELNFLPPLPPKEIRDPLPPILSTDLTDFQLHLDSNAPPTSLDFDLPPFDDDGIPAWEDNTLTDAVYDKSMMTPQISIYNNDTVDRDANESVDMTGSSTYEDAESIVKAAIERRNQSQHLFIERNGSPIFEGEEDFNATNSKITNVDDFISESPPEGPYDFPSALQKHPDNNNDQKLPSRGVTEENYDEPPMELLTFVKKPKEPSPSMERKHNLFPQQDCPPLPERNSVSRSKSLEPTPRHNISPPPLPSLYNNTLNEPPLPPRNPPRSNGQSTMEPPLPPRNVSGRMSSSPGPPSAQTLPPRIANRDREAMVSELVGLRYSRSDVVKALAISQNNPELARLILEGFGNKS